MSARITIVSAGHLAHCPRMVKAADALQAAGYAVRVVSGMNGAWASAADRQLQQRRRWRWRPLAYGRAQAPRRWLVSGARHRAARAMARATGAWTPAAVRGPAFGRLHRDLVRAILEEPFDLLYGGSSGALAPVLEAARRAGTPCAVDFEDFHCAQHGDTAGGRRLDALADGVMREACRDAVFVTAGSAAIAAACADRYGRPVLPVHNVLPLPAHPPRPAASSPGLRLYWFSQTIGPGRGLEDVIDGAGRAGVRVELSLRGCAAAGYVDRLRARAARVAPGMRIVDLPLVDPDAMVDGCAGFDAGVASEPGVGRNNALALSNKALTYPLAGLGLILSATPGQRALADTLHGEGLVYAPGDVHALGEGLRRWAVDAASLGRAQAAAWEAARARWHWEHPAERDALLGAVGAAIG